MNEPQSHDGAMPSMAPPPHPSGPVSSGEALDISWSGSPWSLTGLSFLNTLLTVITLGIYSFWGKTEVRKRMWSAIRLNGEPLTYTGTGKELFLGFLIIFFLFLVPIVLGAIAIQFLAPPGMAQLYIVLYQLFIIVVIFFLTGIAIYRATRYRLSRTTWRGIRGTLTGSSLGYGWTYFWTALLIPFTLGWIMPWRSTKLYGRMTNEQQFGTETFGFTGTAGPLFKRFAVLWFGAILLYIGLLGGIAATLGIENIINQSAVGGGAPPTPPSPATIVAMVALIFGFFILFALLQAWYFAQTYNHFAGFTSYSNARFDLKLSSAGVVWLVITNTLIVLLSLTILQPVASARMAKYIVDRLSLHGPVDLEQIAQNPAVLSKTGEGLATAFDVDAF